MPAAPPIRNAYLAEEVVIEILNFTIEQSNGIAGGLAVLSEGTHEIKLKFRPKAQAENTDTLI